MRVNGVVQTTVSSNQLKVQRLRQRQVSRIVGRTGIAVCEGKSTGRGNRVKRDIQILEGSQDFLRRFDGDAPTAYSLKDGIGDLVREQGRGLKFSYVQDVSLDKSLCSRVAFIREEGHENDTGETRMIVDSSVVLIR